MTRCKSNKFKAISKLHDLKAPITAIDISLSSYISANLWGPVNPVSVKQGVLRQIDEKR
jgi:hypothetical protein